MYGFSATASAQPTGGPSRTKDLTSEFAKKYPDEQVVYLSREERNTIRVEKGQLKVYTKHHQDLLLLSDKVSGYSDLPVYYSSFSEITSLKGQSLVPNGRGGYAIVPVREKFETNEFASGSFYDDFKATHLVYTGLTRGSRLIQDYQEKLNEPRFFGRFFFSTSIPTEDAVFSVEVPAGVVMEWKLFHMTEADVEFFTEVKKKKTVYTWRKRSAPKYKTEPDAPASLYFAPHIVVYIKEYTVKGKTTKLLDGPNSLYSWYSGMVSGVNKDDDPALKKIVDSLTSGITNEHEKVERIFYWVQDNIKYVAFEDGMGGFVPREATTICLRRYGDCKDMASITSTMLRMAGIPAYMTWIGTRNIPYRYLEVPSPMSDNHMICTYISGGSYFFLDATGKNAPFGTPTSMIQGKQAMVGKGDGNYEIVTVPIMEESKNMRIDTVFMMIDSMSNVYGNGTMLATGYEKIDLTYPLDGMTEKERKKFFTRYLQKGTNKFMIDSMDYDNLFQRKRDLQVKYNYSIGGYAHKSGEAIYVNMQLDKSWQNQLLDTAERSAPKEIDYKSAEMHVSILEIPEGYTAGCLPPDAEYTHDDFYFRITYRQEANRIICTKTIQIRTLMVGSPQFISWNEFIGKLSASYNLNITLHKVSAAQPMPGISAPKLKQ